MADSENPHPNAKLSHIETMKEEVDGGEGKGIPSGVESQWEWRR